MRKDQFTHREPSRPNAAALLRWLDLERAAEDRAEDSAQDWAKHDERCEAVLREAIGGWAPFGPLPGFADGVLSAMTAPAAVASWTQHWFWRAAVALVAVQTALMVGLFGTTFGSLFERLGPSGVVAWLARGALSSGRSVAELTSFGRSLADASKVVGAAATTPGVLLVLAGCLVASAAGAWLVSSQLSRDGREMIGAAS